MATHTEKSWCRRPCWPAAFSEAGLPRTEPGFPSWLCPVGFEDMGRPLSAPESLQGAVSTDLRGSGAESSVLRAHIPALDSLPDSPWDRVPPWLLLILPASPAPPFLGSWLPSARVLHQLGLLSAPPWSRGLGRVPWAVNAPLIEGRGGKAAFLPPLPLAEKPHYHCQGWEKCPRREEPFNGGSPGLGRQGWEERLRPRKSLPSCLEGAAARCFPGVHLSKAEGPPRRPRSSGPGAGGQAPCPRVDPCPFLLSL